MSFYSQFTKISYLETSKHNPQDRTEFVFPPSTYAYGNLRLLNVGLEGAVGSLSRIGSVALIKHIYLYSDREVIDMLRFANRYHSFSQLINTNSNNRSVNKILEKSSVGYVYDLGVRSRSVNNQNVVAVAQNTKAGSGGYIELPRLLKLLQSEGLIIDTNKMKNWRLVIECEKGKLKYLSTGTNNTFVVTKPTLAYDEIINPEIGKQLSDQMKNFNFSCIEHDSFDMGNMSDGAKFPNGHVQSVQRKLKGFDNKFVNRLIIIKNFANNTINQTAANAMRGKGAYRSPVQHHEKINIKVNGVPVFDKAIDNESAKQYLTADAWGSLNLEPYEGSLSVGSDNPTDGFVNHIGCSNDRSNVTGMGSYFGCRLESKIEDLEFDVQRQKPQDSTAAAPAALGRRYEQHLIYNVYAEVAKQFIVDKDGFSVRYL